MEIMEMKKKDLPNATAVLVLGILSLVFCWCYGFVGLVLGILGGSHCFRAPESLSGTSGRVHGGFLQES